MVLDSDRNLTTYARVETLKTEMLDMFINRGIELGEEIDEGTLQVISKYIEFLSEQFELTKDYMIPVERIVIQDGDGEAEDYVKYSSAIELIEEMKNKVCKAIVVLVGVEMESLMDKKENDE